MAVLYLTEQGSVLRKEGLLLVVTKEGQALQKVPAGKVDQIIILGNVNLTTPVVQHLLQAGVDCVFCSSHGRYYGRLVSNESGFGALRQRQYVAQAQHGPRLSLARAVVRGKVGNQRALMQRYRRDHPNSALDSAVEALEGVLAKLDRVSDIGSLVGLEGVASAYYFQGLRSVLKQDFGFRTRARRPPPDPVNSLLSLGYTLLAYAVQAAVRIVGLDPFIGYLHATAYSRPSLSLDLMEEFRPIIVDSVVVRMINTGMLAEEDFEHSDEGSRRVNLRQEALKRFIGEFEARVQTRVQHPRLGGTHSYRRCFELQGRQLASVLKGEAPEYLPFLTR